MKKLLYLSFLVLVFLCSCSSQKTETINELRVIRGFVIDERGDFPLPFVEVWVKGTDFDRKTETDEYGKFEIQAKKGEILRISKNTHGWKEIIVTDKSEYKVLLKQIMF